MDKISLTIFYRQELLEVVLVPFLDLERPISAPTFHRNKLAETVMKVMTITVMLMLLHKVIMSLEVIRSEELMKDSLVAAFIL